MKHFQMPGESTDPGATRARDRITNALVELVRGHAYDDITGAGHREAVLK